jgi:hypothetical protein
MFTGKARKSAIAFQPRNLPSSALFDFALGLTPGTTAPALRRALFLWPGARSGCFFIGAVRVHTIAGWVRNSGRRIAGGKRISQGFVVRFFPELSVIFGRTLFRIAPAAWFL